MSPVDFYTKEERKINGVFYTPSFLAEYLAKKVVQYYSNENMSSVMDPACGDGMLLRAFANEILEKEKKSPKIFGIDKDLNAVFASEKIFGNEFYNKFSTNFINADALFPEIGKSSKDGWFGLKTKLKVKNGFDVALSNPPWGSELTEYDSSSLNLNFSLATGQYDVFDLFTEVILNNLQENGVYGLILPDSVFSQEQAAFRCLLSKNTTIHLIARLGEKIFPDINRACVIIVGCKAKANKRHLVDCFRLSSNYKKMVMSSELSLEEVEKELLHKVYQSRFYENDNFLFDIDLRVNEQITFNKIQNNSFPVSQFVTNTRGAEISKKGLVCQCPVCNQWMPYPRAKDPKCSNCKSGLNLENIHKEIIILNDKGNGNVKLKVGENLYRYTSISKSWINILKDGINYKNLNIYNGDKILVRKTGVGITASLDYENTITNQVVYILKLKQKVAKELTLEFVLAILNSRAMTYFLIKRYGENEWKTHPYLTQTMLNNLPFPKIDFNAIDITRMINEITQLVRNEVFVSKEKNISKPTDLYIERIVAHFFKLDKNDYKIIFETLESAEQLIPIKRLMNCSINEIFEVDGI